MHAPIDRLPGVLPKRFPVGTRYVIEGRGGQDGHLRVFSRYIVLPGGRRINVPTDMSALPALSTPAPRHKDGRRTGRTTWLAVKKIARGTGTRRQHRN